MTEKELRKIFSENIKAHRKACNLSQVQLAKKAEISINFINDLETKKKWASPATMVKLAGVFNIEAYELLKPPDTFPDNLGSIIRKYTDTIQLAVEQARLGFLQAEEDSQR